MARETQCTDIDGHAVDGSMSVPDRLDEGTATRPNGRTPEELAVEAQRHRGPDRDAIRDELWLLLYPNISKAISSRYRNLAYVSRVEVSDLLGEAYLLLDKSMDRYDPSLGRPFWPFFQTIVLRHFIDMSRRSTTLKVDSLEVIGDQPTEQDFEVESVDDIIDSLVPQDLPNRASKILVFKLHGLYDWEFCKLAEHFDKSVGTMHNWYSEVKRIIARGYSARSLGSGEGVMPW